ncbi:hypothetical protein [Mycoplasmopsis bovis]|uniref:hypothetical protein n=1 Tax=Mycoplasmopsis bovis TaxID=28903 RepID=UPI001F2F445B|nr:hypothetical protein [Mycoplasmopsis bovis]UCP05848.1 hypothetical protein JNG56_04280 [Mycoplasmopsis bovis]
MSDGFSDGLSVGLSAGLSDGLSVGLSAGLSDGFSVGLSAGLSDGFSVGLSAGLSDGFSVGASCCELVPVPGPGLVVNSYFPVIKFESSMALTVNLLSLNSTVEKWSNVNFSNPFTF